MLHREASADRPGPACSFRDSQASVHRRSHLWRWAAWPAWARLPTYLFLSFFLYFFSFFFWCLLVQEAQTSQGFWLAERLFCCGAARLTMAPLWGWRLCFVLPGEITPSSALQRERRCKIMQRRNGNKVGSVQEFKSCLHAVVLLPLQLNALPI